MFKRWAWARFLPSELRHHRVEDVRLLVIPYANIEPNIVGVHFRRWGPATSSAEYEEDFATVLNYTYPASTIVLGPIRR